MSEPSRVWERETQLEHIVADYLEGLEAGRTEDRQALLAAYPEFAAELAEFFSMRDRVNGVRAPLRRRRSTGQKRRGRPIGHCQRAQRPGAAKPDIGVCRGGGGHTADELVEIVPAGGTSHPAGSPGAAWASFTRPSKLLRRRVAAELLPFASSWTSGS